MIQIKEKISETKQRLSYYGKDLDDGLSLLDYDITKDSTINLKIINGFSLQVFLRFDENPKNDFVRKVRLQETHTVKDLKEELQKLYPFSYENLMVATMYQTETKDD